MGTKYVILIDDHESPTGPFDSEAEAQAWIDAWNEAEGELYSIDEYSIVPLNQPR